MSSSGEVFPMTRWSLVQMASVEEGPAAQRALGELCGMYWKPVYTYIRRRGWKAEEAEDLTQGFFEMVLSSAVFGKAERERGRLRSFLLKAAQRYVGHEYAKSQAQKRGGGQVVLSTDHESAGLNLASESDEGLSPDQAFEKQWALTVLQNALETLEGEHRSSGRELHWEAISPFMAWNAGAGSQEESAAKLGVTIGAFRAALLRMRRRYRTILSDQICETLESPDDLDDEIGYIFEVVGR